MEEKIGYFTRIKIKKRFRKIAKDPNTVMLKYPNHIVSDRPIQSKWYFNCNGVVLLNHNVAGLSHYDLDRKLPEDYLPELIKKISDCSDLEGLIAVLIGGSIKHHQRNKKILEEYKIPIVAEYLDGLNEGESSKDYETKDSKDLVVIPNPQEVLMYSKPFGYLRLYPKEKCLFPNAGWIQNKLKFLF
ncbi:MAG: hypothetical protein KKA61_01405 [Nanoarchaeota archaeon]|nr:hypothetical protein [Nanoarchaeota archaeon]MBU4284409.1 hypothetical protein [Nanoarchaeota archaeon]MBU4493002.1 hypothetical protein [Nanoarchaeota archaeon]